MGTKFSKGDIIVYISGHCVPASKDWLTNLIKPITENILWPSSWQRYNKVFGIYDN